MSLLFSLFIITNLVYSQTLEEGLNSLSLQISSGMTESNKQTIAVIEFSDLNGNITELGKFLSEELITRLFLTKKFQVIERQLLNKVLSEHKLSATGLVDESTAKELGSILGVKAIVSGTITDLGGSVKINARLMSTETGQLFSVASTTIEKDDAVNKLLSKGFVSQSSVINSSENNQTGTAINFYYEDFSDIDVGTIPSSWMGGEKLAVYNDGSKNFIKPFENQKEHKIIVSNISFPDDFIFEWFIETHSGGGTSKKYYTMVLGNVTITLQTIWGGGWSSWIIMNNSSKELSDLSKKIVKISLGKKGLIFKIFLDGQQMLMARYPKFSKPKGFTFSTIGGGINFKIFKILGRFL